MSKLDSGRLGARMASAAVLAPLTIALAYRGGWPYGLMVIAIAALMAYEWDRLWGGESLVWPGSATGIAVAVPLALALAGLWLPAVAALALAAALLVAAAPGGALGRRWSPRGVLYIGILCLALLWLRAEQGFAVVLWVLCVVWATDGGAWAFGKTIGGPRLAPRISPNKTWAGFFGGLLCSAAAAYVFSFFFDWRGRLPVGVAEVFLSLVAQGGDLLESKVKRRFGVKDSGRLIPGHGGVLDRLDSLAAAAPVTALALIVVGAEEGLWQ